MFLSTAIVCFCCFASQISYSSAKVVGGSFLHDTTANTKIRIRSDVRVKHADFHRRQAVASSSSTAVPSSSTAISSSSPPASTPGTLPSDVLTQQACVGALSSLNGNPSNPSGMSMCYNVDYFDAGSGTFEATLLLYQIGAAFGDWASVLPQSMSLGITFPGAAAAQASRSAATNASSPQKRDETYPIPEHGSLFRRDVPQLKSDKIFQGQVNPGVVAQGNQTRIILALAPNVTITGTTADGRHITTQLPNNEATFINGIFANSNALAPPPPSQFVLPGTTLGIFPVGLIITSIWAALFIGAIGLGTYSRFQFRDSYRRRTQGMYIASIGKAMTSVAFPAYDRPRVQPPILAPPGPDKALMA